MLLTRSPLNREPKPPVAFDLHVLGTPPALILSQDQTLKLNSLAAPGTHRTGRSPHFANQRQRNLLTRAPVDLALALFCTVEAAPAYSFRVHRSRRLPRRRTEVRRREDKLTLDGSASTTSRSLRRDISLCLHALSSFQRTGYARRVRSRGAPPRPATRTVFRGTF